MTIFLDFDGVVCDSVLEAYVSSWIAWYRTIRSEEPAAVPIEQRELFYRYRPFIRNGEDFVLLQQLIERGVAIATQRDFDLQLERAGTRSMQQYRNAIYAVRERLLAQDRDAWLRLNRIYPHVRKELDRLALLRQVYILSTKKADYIAEILAGDGVSWPRDRIITSEGRPKISIIGEVLAQSSATTAHFFEDQPDHFPRSPETVGYELHCYLAEWGYIQKQWLHQSGYSVVGETDFPVVIDRIVSR